MLGWGGGMDRDGTHSPPSTPCKPVPATLHRTCTPSHPAPAQAASHAVRGPGAEAMLPSCRPAVPHIWQALLSILPPQSPASPLHGKPTLPGLLLHQARSPPRLHFPSEGSRPMRATSPARPGPPAARGRPLPGAHSRTAARAYRPILPCPHPPLPVRGPARHSCLPHALGILAASSRAGMFTVQAEGQLGAAWPGSGRGPRGFQVPPPHHHHSEGIEAAGGASLSGTPSVGRTLNLSPPHYARHSGSLCGTSSGTERVCTQ